MKRTKYNKQRCVTHILISAPETTANPKAPDSHETLDKSGVFCYSVPQTSKRITKRLTQDEDDRISWAVLLQTLGRETRFHLERLHRAVKENKRVDEASYYCRWLLFSGVLGILERFETSGEFAKLRLSVEDVLRDVGEIYKGGRVAPKYESSDIEAINAKLDYLLSNLPKPSCPDEVEATGARGLVPAMLTLPTGRV